MNVLPTWNTPQKRQKIFKNDNIFAIDLAFNQTISLPSFRSVIPPTNVYEYTAENKAEEPRTQ